MAFALALAAGASACASAPSTTEVRTVKSGRISALDALPAKNPFAMRLSLRRVRGTGLADIVPSLIRETKWADEYGAWMRACKTAPIDAFHDVVISLGDSERLFAAELVVPPDVAVRCVRETFGGREAMFQDHTALRIDGEPPLYVITAGDLLLVGDEHSVDEALHATGRSAPLAKCLDLGRDAFAAACGTPPKVAITASELRATARHTANELALEASLKFASPEDAKGFADRVAAAKKGAADQEKFVRDALASVRAEPLGSETKLRFGTTGDGVAQGAYITALAVGARESMWREEAKALAEEARVNVAAIAEKLRQASPEKPKARGPVFPVAPPPVPAAIPKASTYEPKDEDFAHPVWTQLGVTLKSPIRYQYSIVVSPDRRRATVRAEGDLDGDGDTSRFEITLEAKGGTIVVSPMKVIDERE